MKISWLKSSNDEESFKVLKKLGFDVFEIQDLENTDKKLMELKKQSYTTVIISNEVASYSEDIIKRYNKSEDINIIITPSKEK